MLLDLTATVGMIRALPLSMPGVERGGPLVPFLRYMRYSHSNDNVNNDGTPGFQLTRSQGASIGAASATSAQSCNWPSAHDPQTSTLAMSGPTKSSRIWAVRLAGDALDCT